MCFCVRIRYGDTKITKRGGKNNPRGEQFSTFGTAGDSARKRRGRRARQRVRRQLKRKNFRAAACGVRAGSGASCRLLWDPAGTAKKKDIKIILNSGRSLRRNRSSGRRSGREMRAFAGAKLRPAAPVRAQIQHSIFKISYSIESYDEPAAERTGVRRGGAALRPGAAAGCCAFLGAIHHSRFKIQNYARVAACGEHARSGPAGRELRASAAGRLRPADLSEVAYIKHQRLRPANTCPIDSGQDAPAAERTGVLSSSARLQPSARGRLRAAGRCATDSAGRHFNHNRRLQPAETPHRPPPEILPSTLWPWVSFLHRKPFCIPIFRDSFPKFRPMMYFCRS